MLFVRAGSVAVLIAALSASPILAARAHRAPTSGHANGHARSSSRKAKTVAHPKPTRGQRGIEPERAREIQSALIREKYLSGEPSGQWDAETEAAMQRYQADHGWQTKLTPDSRALIKLGLGPNHAGALSTGGGSQTTDSSSLGAGATASLHGTTIF